MNKAEIIFQSYNKMIENFYNNVLENKETREALHENNGNIEDMLIRSTFAWENDPVDEAEGMTPAGYFNSITSINDTVENFKTGACICEANMPELFLKKLDMYKEGLLKPMLEMAIDKNMIKDSYMYYIPLMAMRVLGRWKAEESTEVLVQFVLKGNVDDELFIETAADTITRIGQPAAELLLNKLEAAENIEETHKYLMSALTKISKENKSDRVYLCLKNLFMKMKDKELGAAYLGEYGDGRIIPALRGYLLKNNGNIPRAEFFEIKSTIQKLGGNIDDLQIRYK